MRVWFVKAIIMAKSESERLEEVRGKSESSEVVLKNGAEGICFSEEAVETQCVFIGTCVKASIHRVCAYICQDLSMINLLGKREERVN